MTVLNLVMYKHPNTNFGDELSHVILDKILTKYEVDVDIYVNTPKTINLCCIGSYISWVNLHYTSPYIWGSGIRTEHDLLNINNKMDIYAVRGPKTKEYLENVGYFVPEVYGDPALLLPKFYKPTIRKSFENKIGIVGHITNYNKYINLDDKFVLINPTWKWSDVVDAIFSCSLILSSSLHGLIIADAYNKPNIWLDEYPLNEGHFKFLDYFESQHREIIRLTHVREYATTNPYSDGNKLDLIKLESSFLMFLKDVSLL